MPDTKNTPLDEEVFRILGFEARAFCRLKFVAFHPDGSVVPISGRNAQGKSSILRAIECALLGKRADPETPIRAGETSSDVKLIVGPEGEPRFTIQRRYTGTGSKLEIRDANGGEKVARPAMLLGELIDSITFDPAEFMAAGGAKTPAARAKRQVEMLLDVCPVAIDLEANAQKRASAYEDRKDVNRDLKQAEALLKAAPEHFTLPEAVDISAEMERKEELETGVRTWGTLDEKASECGREVERIDDAIKKLQEQRAAWVKTGAEAIEARAEIDVDALKEEGRAIVTKIENAQGMAEERARMVGENKAAEGLKRRVGNLLEESDKFTKAIAECDAARHGAIAAAKFPVAGLGLNEDGVTFKGVAFSQASHAEQLKVSLGIAMAKSPQLRVALIRDGNSFDEESMTTLRAMATEHQFQVWVERVVADQEGSVVIEDGEVASE